MAEVIENRIPDSQCVALTRCAHLDHDEITSSSVVDGRVSSGPAFDPDGAVAYLVGQTNPVSS